jgi:Leucine-rich repeat (LRR) protein
MHLPLLTKLKKLDLAENDIGDASVATLRHYPSLQSLNLKKTKLTANGLAQLKATLPGCVIEHD